MYIILNWSTPDVITTVLKDDGSGDTMTFDDREEAEHYAREQLNFNWLVVPIG